MCVPFAFLSAYYYGPAGFQFVEYKFFPCLVSVFAAIVCPVCYVHVAIVSEVFFQPLDHAVQFGRTCRLSVVGLCSRATVAYQSCHSVYMLHCRCVAQLCIHQFPPVWLAVFALLRLFAVVTYYLRHHERSASGVEMFFGRVDDYRRTHPVVWIFLSPLCGYDRCHLFRKYEFALCCRHDDRCYCCQYCRSDVLYHSVYILYSGTIFR